MTSMRGALDAISAAAATGPAVHRAAWEALSQTPPDDTVVGVVDARPGCDRRAHVPKGSTLLLLLDGSDARLVERPAGGVVEDAQDGGELMDLDHVTSARTVSTVNVPRGLDVLWTAAAAGLAVASRRLLDLALARVQTRSQFGRAIGSFQAVQHRLADALLDVEAIELAVEETAAALDDGTGPAGAAAACKLLANESAVRVRAAAHQLCGGYGYLEEAGLGPSTRTIHVLTAGIGPSWVLRPAIVLALESRPP